MSEQEQRGEIIKIGALWSGKTKNGDPCFTGKMGDAQLLVFRNKFKEQPKQPDYIVYVAKPITKREPSQADIDYGANNPHIVDEDDIPF